jgi:hypothetical protein
MATPETRRSVEPARDGGPGRMARWMTDLFVALLVVLTGVILIVVWATSDDGLTAVVVGATVGFIGGCLLFLPLAFMRR